MKWIKNNIAKFPGWIASVMMILFVLFWTYWGAGEMYHEGWWGAWYNRLPYLAPILVTMLPALAAFRWPRAGGITIIAIGVFALFFFSNDVAVIGLGIALVGGAFLFEGIRRLRAREEQVVVPVSWWGRNWRHAIVLGGSGLIFLSVSVYMLPIVLSRVDDGDRSARLIEGNGVDLIWAPEGPGWNWEQPWGGYLSWQDVALYGIAPVGVDDKPGYGRLDDGSAIVFATEEEMAQNNLCRYLNEDGTALMEASQDIWRMPTTDELVRSLGRHGENAGCSWQGEYKVQVQCDTLPDKESPLWSTDHPVIYYWTAESYDERGGYFVAFNGTVNATYKLGGNPRHSYRCVKEP
jgi:hypothetical protein